MWVIQHYLIIFSNPSFISLYFVIVLICYCYSAKSSLSKRMWSHFLFQPFISYLKQKKSGTHWFLMKKWALNNNLKLKRVKNYIRASYLIIVILINYLRLAKSENLLKIIDWKENCQVTVKKPVVLSAICKQKNHLHRM